MQTRHFVATALDVFEIILVIAVVVAVWVAGIGGPTPLEECCVGRVK